MDIFLVISLLGGLAMFLYGMTLLSSGMEKISGGHLEKTLEKLSNNVFKGVLLGAIVTAAIQSSSATTVIVVGLVNAKIMKLRQAIGVIMGANIGTTITSHILRLSDISDGGVMLNLIKPDNLAPIAIMIGVLMYTICKKTRQKEIGHALVGFGLLFTGMNLMSEAVKPLRDLPEFAQMFSTFENPVIGVIVGALVTAIIQSSSASVGILQALTTTGQITYASAFPIIMGQNIGTCITPVLASIGASKGAKRAAFVHFSFNFFGTVIFLSGTYLVHAIIDFPFWNDTINSGGIANFHTLFNISITLLFLPFTGLLEKLAYTIFKSDESSIDELNMDLNSLDDRFMLSPGFAVEHSRKIVEKMAYIAQKNYRDSIKLFANYDLKTLEKIKQRENMLDMMEDKVKIYLVKLSQENVTKEVSVKISQLLQMVNDFERIGDYSINITECAQSMYEAGETFSAHGQEELNTMCNAVDEIITFAVNTFVENVEEAGKGIEPLEEVIDNMEEILKEKHIERLKANRCTIAAGFPFVEALANLERIADHCSNIGMTVILNLKSGNDSSIDPHEYRRMLHLGKTEYYSEMYAMYNERYIEKIENIS